jgi:hypothetical protein
MIGWFVMGAALGQSFEAAPVVATPPAQVVAFADDLYQTQDLTLFGLDAIAAVNFPRPSAWTLTEDPELHLALDHSALLDTGRSSLTIKVNGVALHTLRLDDTNAVNGRVVVPLPRRVLEDHNRIQFEASQHVDRACEDPYDPALWTRILSSSSIHFYRSEDPTDASLSSFPDLLFDPTGLGPLRLTLAGQGPLTESTLDALGRVGLSLGRHAGYRGLTIAPSVDNVAASQTHTLVVGTPQDNPLIGQLVAVDTLEPGQGLVQALRHPTHPSDAVLVVSGADAEGLSKAARALASGEVQELLTGSRMLIDESRVLHAPERDEVPRPVPKALSFTLRDLGIVDQTVRGTYSRAITIPLNLQADAKVRPEGAALRLAYAYGAQLDTARSTVEVLLNGVTLRSVALGREGGDPDAELELDLRDALVHPATEVTVVFRLVPADQEECSFHRNRQLWATVFDSTRFEIDRTHTAERPDLALLRHDLWPLGEALDQCGVAILLPDIPTWGSAGAALQTAAELGRVSAGPLPDLVVSAGGPDALGRVNGRELIVLSDGTPSEPLRVVALTGSLKAHGGIKRRLMGTDGKPLVDAEFSRSATTLEQVIYQTEPVRTALVLQAGDTTGLLGLATALGDPETLRRLDGSAAFLESNGDIATHALAERVVVGQPSIWSRLSLVLSTSGLPLALILAFVGTLITIVIQRWAGERHGQV